MDHPRCVILVDSIQNTRNPRTEVKASVGEDYQMGKRIKQEEKAVHLYCRVETLGIRIGWDSLGVTYCLSPSNILKYFRIYQESTLFDKETNELIYIGESSDISRRIRDHMRKTWEGRSLQVKFNVQPVSILPHNLKELENDLIGWYFFENRKVPQYQFRNYQ